MIRWILVLLFGCASSGFAQNVTINEFMSSNNTAFTDEDGDYSDWIELYNAETSAVDLTGWFLSDDVDQPYKWQIQNGDIQGNGFLVVFASSKDRSGPGQLHTNFNISAAGEELLLSNDQGILVQATAPVSLTSDISFGSLLDGSSDEQVIFSPSSPNASNAEGVVYQGFTDILTFSEEGGFYSSARELTIGSDEGAEIRYTLDGSIPEPSSILLDGPLQLQDLQGQPDEISEIDTGVDWTSPRSYGEKANVVRAASFDQGIRISPIYTETYFISDRLDDRYQGLPVISLSLDADSLFSYDRGIYVAGQYYDPSSPTGSGNYHMTGRDWEREVHMEFFDGSHAKQFAQNAGARIHGNSSRSYPQKTLRLYARSEYGQPYFNYPFFEGKDLDQFKRILLRSSSTDFAGTMFKDILCSELVAEMEMDYMESQVCIVFINGEYWGVHSMRERIDKHYLALNHGVDPDAVDLLALNAEVEEGTIDSYAELLNYVSSHDLSDNAVYDQVLEKLDIENFMDYQIAQLYFANFDWPATNIRYWKGHTDEYKWRWIFYDCDRCLLLSEHDHLIDFVQENNQFNTSPEWTILLFNRLLKNQEFKEEFVQRFFYRLSTTFHGDRVLAEIRELEDIYQPLVVEHMNRWNYPESVNSWNESLQEMKSFVIKRPAVMVQQLIEYIGEQYTVFPNPAQASKGYVSLDMEYRGGVDIQVDIFSPVGELIQSVDLSEVGDDVYPTIPIDRLSAGLYIVRIQYGALVFSEKLVVE